MTTEPVASPGAWRTYEAIARHLLNELRAHLGLSVQHKHSVTGQSGTTWEIDAKGIRKGDEGFVIIECRCYPNDRVTQEEVAGLAYRIWDSGAAGGLVVSPHDLQAGAKLVAAHEGIIEIQRAQRAFREFLKRRPDECGWSRAREADDSNRGNRQLYPTVAPTMTTRGCFGSPD